MRKIKILFAIDRMNIGGAPSVVYGQCQELDKGRFDPYILTLYPSRKANFFAQLDFLNPDHIVQYHLRHRSLFDFLTWYKIFKFLKREKFDIVYTHLFLTNVIVRILAILARVPIILSFEHSIYFDKRRWQIVVDRILARFTKKILVSTEAVADFTARQEKIKRDKFVIIPNPIFLPSRREVNIDELKEEFNLPASAFIVLTLGRFSREKGQIYFIQAAEKVIKKYPNIFFLIVGFGVLENKLKAEVDKRELNKQCRVIVEPTRAKEFFFLADLFVLPSVREGQSIVTYEALMAGIPVIASDLPSIRDIIKDGENGLLFPVANSGVLTERIIYLFKHPRERQRLSKNGLASVENYQAKNKNKFEKLLFYFYESFGTKQTN